jgi:hypothetical protein
MVVINILLVYINVNDTVNTFNIGNAGYAYPLVNGQASASAPFTIKAGQTLGYIYCGRSQITASDAEQAACWYFFINVFKTTNYTL